MQKELSRTLTCMHDRQAVLCFENHAHDSRVKLSGDIAPVINGNAGTGGGNLPLVVVGSHWDDSTNPHPPHLRNLIVHGSQDPIISDIANPIGRNNGAENVLFGSCFIRRLTTVECARLQGFPDHHTEIPWRGKKPEDCPRSPQYKAYGNSMCVNVIEWLGRMIKKEMEHPSGVELEPPAEQLEFDF